MADQSFSNAAEVLPHTWERQAETVRLAHKEMVAECHLAFERWSERRHQTIEAMSEFRQVTMTLKTPQEFLEAWSQWSSAAMDRLAEDAKDQMEVGVSCLRAATNGPITELTSAVAQSAMTMTMNGSGSASPKRRKARTQRAVADGGA